MNKSALLYGALCHKCHSLCVFRSAPGEGETRRCYACANPDMEACLPLTELQFQRMAVFLGVSFLLPSGGSLSVTPGRARTK
jgi:hypothetical protein